MRISTARQVVRVGGAVFLTIGAALCALVAAAARSDFVFRGCADISRAEWGDTVNCSDGWFAQVLMTGVGLCLLVALVMFWRWGRAG